MTTPNILTQRITDLEAECAELRFTHLGILSGPAIRRALRLQETPMDVLAIDFRKLHEWNDLLGRERANIYLARLGQTRSSDRPIPPTSAPRRQAPREGSSDRRAVPRDISGQYGGDELVIAVPCGDGRGLLARMLRLLGAMSLELTCEERAIIHARTEGLLTGFAAVFVLVEGSRAPLSDACRAVAECDRLKSGGRQTGQRATSGRAGTIIGSLLPS